MDQELADRLNLIEKTVQDNNRMLQKMRKSQKNAAYMRIVYWLIIIILIIASMYFIVPYISNLGSSYGIGSGSSVSGASSTLTNLINQYQAGKK
jgi:preprotein translocase subunit SecY